MVTVQPRRTTSPTTGPINGILDCLCSFFSRGGGGLPLESPTSKTRRNKQTKKKISINLILFAILLLFFIKFHFVTVRNFTPTSNNEKGSAMMGDKNVNNGQLLGKNNNKVAPEEEKEKNSILLDDAKYNEFKISAEKLRSEFDVRYGGKESASSVLSKGVHTFHGAHDNGDAAIKNTAVRILRAAASKKREFVLSFGGYSVTVGRGNLFEQSFPFVMERILADPLQKLGVNVVVRNAAIGGIPSFPYGWCLRNFLGEDSDLVSWDYGMNEGNSAEAFEAYVRHAMLMPHQPIVLMLDTKKARMDVFSKYTSEGFLMDPVAVGKGEVVNDLLDKIKEEKDRPPGLKEWDVWGAPKGSPGQSKWHPKKMEHELIGWMIAMHLLESVEMAGEIMKTEQNWKSKYGSKDDVTTKGLKHRPLPKPMTSFGALGDGKSATSIMLGTPLSSDNGDDQQQKWHMNSVSCRTSFLPVLSGTLDSIAISGVAKAEDDIMSSRDDQLYHSGWVVDIGKVERDTKAKVARFGGLGYIDMKTALYGIPESGTLRFWLPYEGPHHLHSHSDVHEYDADHWFDSIIVCEVNEKRTADECKMESDLTFAVGGIASPSVVKIEDAAAYLRKKICVSVKVPSGASVMKRKDIVPSNGAKLAPHAEMMLREDWEGNVDEVGLLLDITVTGKGVTRENGACSISHIVWEQH